MHFKPGMTCCKQDRVTMGLDCDYQSMIGCALCACRRAMRLGPQQLHAQLLSILRALPAGDVAAMARTVGCMPAFIDAASQVCAAHVTKQERQLFLAAITPHLVTSELERFEALHAAEWKRLRGK
ncbi:hypothetical protein [Chitinasiproducens palmae]|uniref:Uncharacterized protein n=1 Tax=Chitinasiproducens palmae TaxID=1770053 RepID=A0A1H2PNW2_9BURK|nr:hypothetical protein [Chitinasiproducens palmae]SDV47929.1 hypothetical protein SAMN05216551_1047 [Chitinasiproducens palmae]